MPAQKTPDSLFPSTSERKRELVAACTNDRVALVAQSRQRPPRGPAARVADTVMDHLGSLTEFLPGRVGRWARRASLLTRLGRQFGFLRR